MHLYYKVDVEYRGPTVMVLCNSPGPTNKGSHSRLQGRELRSRVAWEPCRFGVNKLSHVSESAIQKNEKLSGGVQVGLRSDPGEDTQG